MRANHAEVDYSTLLNELGVKQAGRVLDGPGPALVLVKGERGPEERVQRLAADQGVDGLEEMLDELGLGEDDPEAVAALAEAMKGKPKL